MSKEAMKLALEALEKLVRFESDSWEIGSCRIAGQATKALREALAEQPAPVQQEPVAAECKFDREQKWVRCEIAHHNSVQSEPHNWPGYQTRLLYTSPPAQRKPLTFSKLCDIEYEITHRDGDFSILKFARAIEAAHGIKGDA